MPHICGPHSNLPNCRYFDKLSSEQNPNWVPAAGTGTMDKQKRFPRPQNTNQWEPKSNIAQVNQQKMTDGPSLQFQERSMTPKHEGARVSDVNPIVINSSHDNWAGRKKSIYIQPQPQTDRRGCKDDKSSGEDIFPRKKRSDLNPQI